MKQQPIIILATDTKVVGYGESDSSGCWIKFQLLPEHMEAIRGRRGDMVDIVIAEPQEAHGEDIAAPKPKPEKGPYGQAWTALYKSGWWYCPDAWPLFGSDEDYLTWLREGECAFKSPDCGGDIAAAHVRRVASGAGVGIKPKYSAIPLCHACHQTQHQKGESALGGKDAFDELANKYRTLWMKESIYNHFDVDSLSQLPPNEFRGWVYQNIGLFPKSTAYLALPKEFK